MGNVDTTSGLRLSGDTAGNNTQVLRNFRQETADGEDNTANVPRYPISAYTTTNLTDTVKGIYRFKTHVVAICADGYAYQIDDINPTLPVALTVAGTATSIIGGGKRAVFAEDASDCFVACGAGIYKWAAGTALMAAISDGSSSAFPEVCTHVAVIGQRVVANDKRSATNRQRFFYSDLGDGGDSTWTALGFQTAEGRSDEVVAVYENTAELFVFGTSTTQVYSVGSDPVAPFAPSNTMNVGLHAYYSPVLVDDRFAMVDNFRRIILTDGRQFEIISDDIEGWLAANTINDAFGWRERSDRYDLLFFQFPTAHKTFVYNLKTKRWSEDAMTTGATTDLMPIGGYAYRESDNTHLFGSSTASAIYSRATSRGLDLGSNPIICERMTGVHRHGSYKHKRSGRVRTVCRRGTSGPTGTSDVLEVRVRNDGGDWSDWQQHDIGNDGDAVQHVDSFFGGVFVGRVYHTRYAGTDDTALIEVNDELEEVGT